MPQIVNKKSVLEMAMGAIAEITDYEVERVVANIMDPKRDQERARQEEAGKWQALARQELEAFDSWPLVTRLKDLGLTIRERKMADGGRLIIAVDDLERFSGHVDGFRYRECFAVRLGPNGERAGRDGDINALEWYKRWYSTGAGIEGYIAEDIERSEKK